MDEQREKNEWSEYDLPTEDGEQVIQLWFEDVEEEIRLAAEAEEKSNESESQLSEEEEFKEWVREKFPGLLEKEERKTSAGREILQWVMVIAISCIVAFMINKFLLINARIVSGSMETTIMTDARVMGWRLSYLYSEPERGDIVIFRSEEKDGRILIKRVIGLPGETVSYKNGQVYIDGEPLQEEYLKEPMLGTFQTYEVPEGCYYLLGDNRNESADSRLWRNPGIPKEDILGKAIFIYWKNFKWLA